MTRRAPSVLLLLALLAAGLSGVACSQGTENIRVGAPTVAPATAATDATGLATRPPATRRPATPTPPALINGFNTIAASALPSEAHETLDLIDRGGPYPYRQDDQVFQNRESILPNKPRGYYHEYTVETPGSADRGARRIIAGDGGEFYYTDDHYESFRIILINE